MVRTSAPRGNTPVLQYHFNWKQLSVIAGVTWMTFYFKLHPGTINSVEVREFLKHVRLFLAGRLMIICDDVRGLRSKPVRQFIERLAATIELAFLPAYAPELDAVEYLCGYWKTVKYRTSARRASPTSQYMRKRECSECAADDRP